MLSGEPWKQRAEPRRLSQEFVPSARSGTAMTSPTYDAKIEAADPPGSLSARFETIG